MSPVTLLQWVFYNWKKWFWEKYGGIRRNPHIIPVVNLPENNLSLKNTEVLKNGSFIS
jgi:hypothetical protein